MEELFLPFFAPTLTLEPIHIAYLLNMGVLSTGVK